MITLRGVLPGQPVSQIRHGGARIVSDDLERNWLLAVLPKPIRDRRLLLLEPVELRFGQVLLAAAAASGSEYR